MMESIGFEALLRAALLLVIGWGVAKFLVQSVQRIPEKTLSTPDKSLLKQGVTYGTYVIFIVMAIHQLGFNLTVLLGAAGILSVAIGFASQTSASNLISGIFLLIERSFSIGDVIKVGDITGEVLSIDLLSVKLRTFDNLFIRIPNENLMKSTVTSLSRFPIRRYDMKVGIAYKEDIRKARDVLLQVGRDFHLCLDEPAPVIIMQGFGESSVDLQFSVWGVRTSFLDLRNGIQERVKEAFDREGIEIPFPHRTIYTGSQTDAMPIEIVKSKQVEAGKE
jgi:small-conductance mechanosensitive channel